MVSQRRLYEEILKITYKPYSAPTFKACHDAHLLQYLLPEMDSMLASEDATQLLTLIGMRDQKITMGSSLSRAYSLAILCYRFVEKSLNPDSDFGDGWEAFDGIDLKVREAVEEFLQPYHVTRLVSARVRDVLLLQRRFKVLKGRNKTRRHPEFHYAWLLFNTLAETFDWPKEITTPWENDDTLVNKRPKSFKKRGNNR